MQAPIDSTAAAILAQLRDVRIPDDPDWWPPALGWWLIFFAVSITVGVTLYREIKRRHQMRCPAWHALNELDDLWDAFDDGEDASRTLQRLSALMRRTAISMSAQSQVASLTGDAWLAWLDRHAPETLFSDASHLFADAPYRKTSAADVTRLFESCELWLAYNSDKRTLDDNSPD